MVVKYKNMWFISEIQKENAWQVQPRNLATVASDQTRRNKLLLSFISLQIHFVTSKNENIPLNIKYKNILLSTQFVNWGKD